MLTRTPATGAVTGIELPEGVVRFTTTQFVLPTEAVAGGVRFEPKVVAPSAAAGWTRAAAPRAMRQSRMTVTG